jgi:hypothetical protein
MIAYGASFHEIHDHLVEKILYYSSSKIVLGFSRFCPQFLILKYNLRYLNLLFYLFIYLFYY